MHTKTTIISMILIACVCFAISVNAWALDLPPVTGESTAIAPIETPSENSQQLSPNRFATIRLDPSTIAKDVDSSRFIKSRDLSHVIAEKISLLAVTVTQRQGGTNNKMVELASKTSEISRRQHLNYLAIPHYDHSHNARRVNGDELRLFLSHQTRKSTEVRAKQAFPIIERIQRGFNFKLSMNAKDSETEKASSVPNIRYGLVVQDIEPTEAPSIALIDSSIDSEMIYARKARVTYTIDKLNEDQSRNPVFAPIPDPVQSEVGIGSSGALAHEIFKRKPSTDVNMHVEAANGDDTVSDKVGAGSVPGARVTLTQADGLWATQILTTSKAGMDNLTHEAKLPIFGEANITRKFDKSFKAIRTSGNNLLAASDAPKLNVHHLVLENRFTGEMLMQRPLYEWGVTVEPRVGWSPGQPVSQQGDRVSFKVLNRF